MIHWRPYGGGFETIIGPIRMFIHCRGTWVADVAHLKRTHGLRCYLSEDGHPTAADAKNRAESVAREWIAADIAELQQALTEAQGPLHIPCPVTVETTFSHEIVPCRDDAGHAVDHKD